MVEHQTMTETRSRVDIDAEHFRHAVLQEIRQRFAAVLIKPVVDAVCLYGVETFEYNSGSEYSSQAGSRS